MRARSTRSRARCTGRSPGRRPVQPPTAVTFQLSVPLASDTVSKAVGAILKAAFNVAGDWVADAMPTKSAGKVAAAPFDAVASTMTNRSAAVLGGRRVVELRAVRDIEKTASGGGRGPSSRTRRIAAKGDVVARLSLVFEPRP